MSLLYIIIGDETTNLLKETEHVLKIFKKKPADIDWIGSEDGKYAINWEQFKNLAASIDYDAGYGAQEIARDLVVVFKDGDWLTRDEYDGAESWELQSLPKKRIRSKPIYRLCVNKDEVGWTTIAEMNRNIKSDD